MRTAILHFKNEIRPDSNSWENKQKLTRPLASYKAHNVEKI